MADEPMTPAPANNEPTPAPPALIKPEGQPAEGPGNILADPPASEPPVEPPKEGEPPAEPPAVDYSAIKLPDGVELALDDFTKIAGEHKLPVEAAQSLIDMHVSALEKAGEAAGQAWVDLQKQWQGEIQADPEIGGNNLASMKATVAKAMDQFGDPGLREALILTGAGNNPAIVRTLFRMAKELTEGGHVQGEPFKPQPKSAAQAMYPDLPSAVN